LLRPPLYAATAVARVSPWRDRNRRDPPSYFYSKGAHCTTAATVTSSYNGSAAVLLRLADCAAVSQHRGVAEPCTCLQIIATRSCGSTLCIVPHAAIYRANCEPTEEKGPLEMEKRIIRDEGTLPLGDFAFALQSRRLVLERERKREMLNNSLSFSLSLSLSLFLLPSVWETMPPNSLSYREWNGVRDTCARSLLSRTRYRTRDLVIKYRESERERERGEGIGSTDYRRGTGGWCASNFSDRLD
jgi:hypothetical protein